MKKLIVILSALMMSACVIDQSTVKHEGKWRAYDLSETQIKEVVYQELDAVENHGPIKPLTSSVHGYQTRIHSDWAKQILNSDEWFDVSIYIIPVEGMDWNGKQAKGFIVEISGAGTYPTGQPEMIIRNIRNKLDMTGSSVFLVEYQRTEYALK